MLQLKNNINLKLILNAFYYIYIIHINEYIINKINNAE